MKCRRLDGHLLVYHCGSGDTHLLTPLSDGILIALAAREGKGACSLADLRADHGLSSFEAGDRELAEALWMLEAAGIVRAAGNT